MKAITLGYDPEVHLLRNRDNRVVSSLRVLKRDKTKPIDLKDGIRMYADNVLTEFACPPSTSVGAAMSMMRASLCRVQEHLGDSYSMLAKAAHVYESRELVGKKCWETGCNPNFDVYAGTANAPADFQNGLRTGSFHIHLGHPDLDGMDKKEEMVKLLDVFVGCASILFDRDPTSGDRRSLYGKAGEFRPTPYGIEYRVLGNWALRSPKTTQLALELVLHAVHHWEIGDAKPILEACGPMKVQLAINGHERKLAKDLLEIAALPMKLMDRCEEEPTSTSLNEAWGI